VKNGFRSKEKGIKKNSSRTGGEGINVQGKGEGRAGPALWESNKLFSSGKGGSSLRKK